MKLVTRQIADVSLYHITEEDNDLLKNAWSSGMLCVYSFDYGFLIPLGPWMPTGSGCEALERHMRAIGYSAELIHICRIAGAQGCTMLCLDIDGEEYDDLPMFEW
jgi:hypothetical protein